MIKPRSNSFPNLTHGEPTFTDMPKWRAAEIGRKCGGSPDEWNAEIDGDGEDDDVDLESGDGELP